MDRKELARRVVLRLLSIPIVALLAFSFVFWVVQALPGDPARAVFDQSTASDVVVQQRREALGLDDPLPVQYWRYLTSLLQADFGSSWSVSLPVNQLLLEQFIYTLRLTTMSLLVAVLLGTVLGVAAATQPRLAAAVGQIIGVLCLSTPVMFSGLLALWLFSIRFDLLPAVGQGTLAHILMPSVVVGASVAGTLARSLEINLLTSKQAHFVRSARSRGLSDWQVLFRHQLPVTALPTLNILALQAGFLLTGAVITESIFNRSGMGSLLLRSVLIQDWPVLWGAVTLTAAAYAALFVIVDIIHIVLNPSASAL